MIFSSALLFFFQIDYLLTRDLRGTNSNSLAIFFFCFAMTLRVICKTFIALSSQNYTLNPKLFKKIYHVFLFARDLLRTVANSSQNYTLNPKLFKYFIIFFVREGLTRNLFKSLAIRIMF